VPLPSSELEAKKKEDRKEKAREAKRIKRLDPVYRNKERVHDAASKKKKRSDPIVRAKRHVNEKDKDAAAKAKSREDNPDERAIAKDKDAAAKAKAS
jgi:hypothetical protein